MTERLSHERCSEQLPAFVAGALPDDDARAVDAHLQTCDLCRAERVGLEALMAPAGESLTVAERATLERRVMAGISEETGEHPVVPIAPRRRTGWRWAGALGAAATVAVIASVAYFGGIGGLDSPTMQGAESDGSEQGRGGAGDARRKNAPISGKIGADSEAALEASSEGTAVDASKAKAPAPTFRVENDPLTGAYLQKRGESSLESVSFVAYYSADDAGRKRPLLRQLVDKARASSGETVAEQVERCATDVLDTSDPTLPTFGMVGTLDDRDVLVLGFAWTRADSGPLDRYMVWAWRLGSCDVAVDFVEGKIQTTN